jgi:hypothetical protein
VLLARQTRSLDVHRLFYNFSVRMSAGGRGLSRSFYVYFCFVWSDVDDLNCSSDSLSNDLRAWHAYNENGHLLALNLPSDLRSRLRLRLAGAWKFICEWSMFVTDAIVLWLLSRNSPVSAHTAREEEERKKKKE